MSAGETITFRITNTGSLPHDFTIGDQETKDLTWHFTESGTVLIGCHQTGHYEVGMKGAVAGGVEVGIAHSVRGLCLFGCSG